MLVVWAGLGAGAFVLVLVTVVVLCCCIERRKRRRRERDGARRSDEENIIGARAALDQTGQSDKTPPTEYINTLERGGFGASADRTVPLSSMTWLEEAMRRTIESQVIGARRLRLQDRIGAGGFGIVYKGQLFDRNMRNPKDVAVKTVHTEDGSSKQSTESFLQEAMLMKGFRHRHVLTMIGLVFKGDVPHVVLPFMNNGDLKHYLSRHDKEFLVGDLLEIALQVADGMVYLSEQNFVHRDLAARNCMVDKDGTVKVADFGLSRDIFCDDYYVMADTTTPLPVRWMAPECIMDRKFSTKSDVWAYGVVLWEIMTRGRVPYRDLSSAEVVKHVVDGGRLDEPKFCPPKIYALMQRCWALQSGARPGFPRVVADLRRVLAAPDVERNIYYNSADVHRGDQKKRKKARK